MKCPARCAQNKEFSDGISGSPFAGIEENIKITVNHKATGNQ
jgi:hypothetical protein